ncbi:MAG: SemiSWEET transporter [Flavobacteriaceae bacterium]|jgi:MtN3 and saliva related transmembrane protein|nr:SemiSWEET transporter [Flavobacteriaceae bacterium]MDG2315220.1 SemiSWEET transporter [Flavobacteriaceae bacterium]
MDISIEWIGFIAALLTTGAFVPQVFKTLKTQSTDGLSLTMYMSMFVGIMLWLFYGIKIQSLSMIVANVVTGGLTLSMLVMIIRNKKKNK